jgi:hypothetical protein
MVSLIRKRDFKSLDQLTPTPPDHAHTPPQLKKKKKKKKKKE